MLFTLLLLETGLRLIGFGPFQFPDYTFESSPKKCFSPKDNIGVTLVPGTFQVTMNGKLDYTAVHTADGLRSTGTNHTEERLPIVQFHGCSFTYGMGVSDSETYPYLLQQEIPQFNIQNHGVPGYGQIQLLNQLRKQVQLFQYTKYIVLNYIPFHDERNALNAHYEEKLNIGYQLTQEKSETLSADFSYPFAKLEGDELIMDKRHIQEIVGSFELRTFSAIANQLSSLVMKLRSNGEEDFKLTKAIIEEINQRCENLGIELLMTFMGTDSKSQEMAIYCQSIGIETVDISVDFSDDRMINTPHDRHPSPAAHVIFSNKLSDYFQRISLEDSLVQPDSIPKFEE